MSKNLSLKLKDEIFSETEVILKEINKPRNAYINDALDFYNKFVKRSLLKKQLKNESGIVADLSMKALHELALTEDEIPE